MMESIHTYEDGSKDDLHSGGEGEDLNIRSPHRLPHEKELESISQFHYT